MDSVLFGLGAFLILLGSICSLFSAIGMLKFPHFFLRLHAVTVGTVGGGVVPGIGISLLALGSPFLGMSRYPIAAVAFATALIILLTAPTGTHALAQSAYKAKTDLKSGSPVRTQEMAEKEGGEQ